MINEMGVFSHKGKYSGPKVIKLFSYLDYYSVLGVCAPLSMTLKKRGYESLEYVLRWVGFGVRTPSSKHTMLQEIALKMHEFRELQSQSDLEELINHISVNYIS